jgi:dihydropteroate synthase
MRHTVSIDTRKPGVMRHAIAAAPRSTMSTLLAPGASMPSRVPDATSAVHMQGEPATCSSRLSTTMSCAKSWGTWNSVLRRVATQESGGRIVVILVSASADDRGTTSGCFASGSALNASAHRSLPDCHGRDAGVFTSRPVDQRVHAGVGAALAAVERGAAIVRIHDVGATVDALKGLARAALRRRVPAQTLIAAFTTGFLDDSKIFRHRRRSRTRRRTVTPDWVLRLGYAMGRVLVDAHARASGVLIGRTHDCPVM